MTDSCLSLMGGRTTNRLVISENVLQLGLIAKLSTSILALFKD